MISKNLLKSSLIYTLSGMLPMASAIVLLPLYISNLTTEAYGALSVYMVFTLLVQIIVTFSFDTSIYIHYHELKNDKEKLAAFVSSSFIFMLLLGAVVTLMMSVSGGLLFRLVLSESNISFYPYGLASVGTGVFQAVFKVHSSMLQSREKPETFLWSNVVSFSLTAIFIIVGFELYPHSLAGPIVGRFLGAILPGLWALMRIFREFGFHTNFEWLQTSFSFNAYTFIYQLQQWVINQFDRILMVFFLTGISVTPLADVGVYDFAIKCMIPVELLMNSLHSSFYPKVVSKIIAQDSKGATPEINRYYHGLTAVIMMLICGGILLLPPVIDTWVSREAYHEAVQYIPFIAGIYFFRTMRLYFSVPYGILKYTKPLTIIYIVISGIKIVGMMLLIPYFTVYGVIIASLVSAVVEVILLRINISSMYQFRFNTYKIVVAPVLLMSVIFVLEPLTGVAHPYTTHIGYTLICAVLLWWTYRNEIQLVNPFRSAANNQ